MQIGRLWRSKPSTNSNGVPIEPPPPKPRRPIDRMDVVRGGLVAGCLANLALALVNTADALANGTTSTHLAITGATLALGLSIAGGYIYTMPAKR